MDSIEATIAAPPNGIYGSHELALNALKQHALVNGYGFLLHQSKPHGSNTKTRFYYRCDKHRRYKSQATIKNTKSRTNGCSFSLCIFHDSKSLQWHLQVNNPSHNHGPSLNPSAHNIHRKRTQTQKNEISRMTAAGITPKNILTSFQQQDPDTLIAPSDIHNDRKTNRANQLGGRSHIEALLDNLSTSDWIFDLKKDSENHIQYLFFAHKKTS